MTKELKHDFALAKEIIRRCGDLFETESFYNNKTIPVLLARLVLMYSSSLYSESTLLIKVKNLGLRPKKDNACKPATIRACGSTIRKHSLLLFGPTGPTIRPDGLLFEPNGSTIN